MRISTQQQYNISISRMQNSQNTLGDLQRQIATGKKIHQPSDMPAVAAEAVRLDRDIAALDRYDNNITVVTNRLELEETMLSSINTQMDRMRELTLSAASGTKNDANRVTIAREIREIVASVAGIMNKKDAQGEYLFSGSQGYTQPYVLNTDGRWEYQGDNGQREIQVGATHYVASNDSGQYLFESVKGELKFGHSGAANIQPATQFSYADNEAKEAFEAYVKDQVEGDLQFRLNATATAGEYSFEIHDSSGKVHYPDPAAPAPAPLAAPFPQDVEFEGLKVSVKPPGVDDYSFPISRTANRVQEIRVTDQAEVDQFFLDYGDVDILFDSPGAGSYQLQSAKTGGLVSIDGKTDFQFSDPDTIKVGGVEIDVAGTAGSSYTLAVPSKDNILTQVNNIGRASVSDVAAFESQLGAEQLKLEILAGNQYRIVDESNSPVSPAVPGSIAIPGAPSTEIVDSITGLTFHHTGLAGLKDGDSFTVQLQDTTQVPAELTPVAISTVEVQYEQKNILNIGLEVAEQLELGGSTEATLTALNEKLTDTLTYITEAQDRVTAAITGVGARLSALEDTKVANMDVRLLTKTTLSAIEDADLAEVASNLKLEEVLLQASQQTFASVSKMTLFNYIK